MEHVAVKEQYQIGTTTFWVRSERKEQDIEIIHEVFVNDSYRLRLKKLLGYSPKVVLDIGGHIGTFAVLAKTLWPDAVVIGCEPHSESFELYKKNIEPFSNAYALNCAVCYDSAQRVLLNAQGSTGGCVLKNKDQALALENAPVVEGKEHYAIINEAVPTLTVEEVLAKTGQHSVDLLKLDCEGSELNILPHLPTSLTQQISFVVGEYHIDGGLRAFTPIFKKAFPHFYIAGCNPLRAVAAFWAGPTAVPVYLLCTTMIVAGLIRRVKRLLVGSP